MNYGGTICEVPKSRGRNLACKNLIFCQSLAARGMRRDLGQPDGSLDGFHLAEERPDAAELVMPPMLE
jgi:hypothetical protein